MAEIKIPLPTNEQIEKIVKRTGAKYPKTTLKWERPGQTVVGYLTKSYDGNMYGFRADRFIKSEDSGVTRNATDYFLLDVATYGYPQYSVVFPNGELVIVTNKSSIKSYVLKTTNFEVHPTVVKEIDNFVSTLSCSSWSNGLDNYLLVGEYNQVKGSINKLWFSSDTATTFSNIKDTVVTNALKNSHWHTAQFDPYSGSIIAVQGDFENARIFMSYDMGVTWKLITSSFQPTAIVPMPNYIFFGNDEAWLKPGLTKIERPLLTSDYENIELKEAYSFQVDYTAPDFYPQEYIINQGLEAYIFFGNYSSQSTKINYILATGDGGISWHIVACGKTKISQLIGPDKNGYIFGINGGLVRSKKIEWE